MGIWEKAGEIRDGGGGWMFKKDCKRNLKCPPFKRVAWQIYNGTI